jgi:glycopeptide antibiotics resistance protein
VSEHRSEVRTVAGILLVLYAVVIARLTLAPAASESGTFGLPNHTMLHVSDRRVVWSQTEVLANIALFVPAGLLLSIGLGRAWAGAILCVLVAAGIELAQRRYLPSRVPSVLDIEHNGLGGLIGALLGWPIAHSLRLRARRAVARRRRDAVRRTVPLAQQPTKALARF